MKRIKIASVLFALLFCSCSKESNGDNSKKSIEPPSGGGQLVNLDALFYLNNEKLEKENDFYNLKFNTNYSLYVFGLFTVGSIGPEWPIKLLEFTNENKYDLTANFEDQTFPNDHGKINENSKIWSFNKYSFQLRSLLDDDFSFEICRLNSNYKVNVNIHIIY